VVPRTPSTVPEIPVVPLPSGIPGYSMRHGRNPWPPGMRPAFMLYPDWDLLMIDRGAVAASLGTHGEYHLDTDDFMLLPPFTPVTLTMVRQGVVLAYCHFAFRLPPPALLAPRQADLDGPGERALVPVRFSRGDAPDVWRAYRAMLDARLVPASPWRLERVVLDVVAELAAFGLRHASRAPDAPRLAPRRLDPRLEQARALVVADPARRWRLAELARAVQLSPSRLRRLHHDAFGTSLKRTIVDARLERAMRLLRSGERPGVAAVARACGFASQAYFSRAFRARFRIAPLAYRDGDLIA